MRKSRWNTAGKVEAGHARESIAEQRWPKRHKMRRLPRSRLSRLFGPLF
jgi:hypothetical protein